MRYIADSDGYVKEVSFGAVITCGTSECVEYTGTVPEGYTSVEDWFNVCGGELYRWKIVDGNLTPDPSAEAPVEPPSGSDTDIVYLESVDDMPAPGNAGQLYVIPQENAADDFTEIVNRLYPVGTYYWSSNATNPATLFGVGTWERVKDKFLLAAGDTYAAGATGGEATHSLSQAEMPAHYHTIFYGNNSGDYYTAAIGFPAVMTSNGTNVTKSWGAEMCRTADKGDGEAHNNMPPYLAVYCWHRTA